jgi:hypothetical protein
MAARLRPYIEIVRHTQRNVKRWQDGDMRKRWTAAGMLVAEQQFRRIIGYRNLAKLVIAIDATPTASSSPPPPLSPTLRCQKPLLSDCQSHVRTATKVPRRSGHPRGAPRVLREEVENARLGVALAAAGGCPPIARAPRSRTTY